MDERQVGETATDPGARSDEGPRRMTRPRSGRILGGVASGLARHLRLDVTLARVLVVVVTLVTSGLGLLAYGLLWLLIPSEDAPDAARAAGWSAPGTGGVPGADPRGAGFWVGLGMVGVGALWLMSTGGAWFGSPSGGGGWLLPLVLIGAGLALWLSEDRADAGPGGSGSPGGGPGGRGGPSATGGPGDAGATPARAAGTGAATPPGAAGMTGTTTVGGPVDGGSAHDDAPHEPTPPPPGQGAPPLPPAGGQGPPPGDHGVAAAAHGPGTPPPPPRERSPLTRVTLGLGLLVGGVAWLLGRAGLLEVGPRTVVAAALLVVGLGLLVGTFWGRGRLLVLAGAPLALLLIAAMTLPFVPPPGVWPGTVGQSLLVVDDPATLRSSYEHGAGEVRLDLRDLELDRDATTRITLGAGQLQVLLPASLAVEVDARATVGDISVLGVRRTGIGPELQTRDGADGGPTLELDLRLGAGEIDVHRAGSALRDSGEGRDDGWWFGERRSGFDRRSDRPWQPADPPAPATSAGTFPSEVRR